MIAPMDRVEIVFLSSELDDMVSALQRLGVLHLEDVPLALENHPGFLHRVHLPEEKKRELERLTSLSNTVHEAIALLSAPPHPADVLLAQAAVEAEDFPQWEKRVRAAHRTLRSLTRRKLNVQDNLEVIESFSRTLESLWPLMAANNVVLGDTARAVLLHGFTREGIDALKERLRVNVGVDCRTFEQSMGRDSVALVIAHPREKGEAVSALLKAEGVGAIEAPDRDIKGASIGEVLMKIERKTTALHSALDLIVDEIAQFSAKYGAGLAALDKALSDRIAQLSVVERFAQSELIAVIHGWVPSSEFEAMESALKKEFGARAAAGKLSTRDVDIHRIPTKLSNHAVFKPFELLMGMFSPPTYGHLDPTPMVAVSFVLFYGFILGDIGYGLFIMAVANWARKKFAHHAMVRDAMTIAMWMGGSTIFWGIIYAEFFGDLPYRLLNIHAIFHREHYPIALLLFAFCYGIIHIPLSLIIGIREGFKHHHHEHAEEKLGMLLGLFGVFTSVATLVGYFPLGSTLGWAAAGLLFAASIFYLVKSMGAMFLIGVIELIGLTANVLSYGRLMALGMAGVALAGVANMMLNADGPLLIVGILGAALVHMLNIGIGVFSPTIHSLRLNYVEFLPKFYEPEGRNYQPFRKELAS